MGRRFSSFGASDSRLQKYHEFEETVTGDKSVDCESSVDSYLDLRGDGKIIVCFM